MCAGAGMGVDSGLPDFRGPEGFWRAYPPYRRLGLRFEEIADPEHFHADPELAWGFYGHRLALYRRTVPHAGYAVLRRWADRWPTRVFTSNVDGAFQAAGFDPETVVECHGAIGMLQCTRPCHDGTWSADGSASEATGRRIVDVAIDEATMRARPPLPACPRCGAVARPNILMFGDGFWVPGHHAERMAAHREWLRAQDAQRPRRRRARRRDGGADRPPARRAGVGRVRGADPDQRARAGDPPRARGLPGLRSAGDARGDRRGPSRVINGDFVRREAANGPFAAS